MNTLTIPQIFSNLAFYQENYISILSTPESYFTKVDDAFVDLFPFKKQNLFLGDLLQLWFSEKWLVKNNTKRQFKNFLTQHQSETQPKNILVYAITGNVFTGENQSQGWNSSTRSKDKICLDNCFKHYCEFKALTRPKEISFSFKHSKKIA